MLRERGFWPALALVVVGHGAVLSQWRIAPWSVEAATLHLPSTWAFQVRTVQPEASPAPQQPMAARVAPIAAGPSPPRPVQPQPQPTPMAPAIPALLAAPASAAETATGAGTEPPYDPPYLPRAELSVPPILAGLVDVQFPEDVEGVVNLTVQATLFIDEDGIVRRVRLDAPDVHPSFERAILEAFGSARFAPGRVDDMPVRSQMRVEVEFRAPAAKR